MKLKKIASLMLAGVMAVSMLAGCQNANVDPEQPTDPETPTVVEGDISDGVAANIDDLPSYIEFAGDSALSSSLDYVVGFANVMDLTGGFYENDLNEIRGGNAYELQSKLEKAVGVTKWEFRKGQEVNLDLTTIGDREVILKAEEASTVEIDDAKAVQLYVASGVIEEDALNTLVAEEIEDTIKDYVNVAKFMVGHGNGIYDHSYTVSVSVDSKEVNGVEATFVAVQVVRTSVRS